MSHGHACAHCTSPAAEAEEQLVQEPVCLPDKPTPIRVHSPGLRPLDCTLHPDGRMTMQVGSQVLASMLGFDEMRQTSWAAARIEWDPAALAKPEPVQPAAMQEPLAP